MASERIAAKRAALRLRIIEVALKAFAARGFEATTMTGIADQLQMTGPALYHYFATKDQLLYACVDQLLDQLLADVGKAAARR
jgi:AcrR family transcriptional regulator